METVQTVMQALLGAVRSGGKVILQILNLLRLADGPCLWQKSLPMHLSHGHVLVLKGVHRSGDRGFVNLVVLSPADGSLFHSESVRLLGLRSEQLTEMALRHGATGVEALGDYHRAAFDPSKSLDLILVINK
jgi:hypothetical protein